MQAKSASSEYTYNGVGCGHAHDYLLPTIEKRYFASWKTSVKRVFDLGCGNGAVANWLHSKGFEVAGVDPSVSGIECAKKEYPQLDLRVGSAYDPLESIFGTFPLVISLEVVEHVYAPRDYITSVKNLLEPNGLALISTPYHGYLKNLMLALTNRLDQHFTALWDHGHIKFWSVATLTQLCNEVGLEVEAVHRVGRIAPFAKSMIIAARRVS